MAEEPTTTASEPPEGAAGGVPRPQLFRLLDAADPLAPVARHSLSPVELVSIGRGPRGIERRREGGQHGLVLALPDAWLSSRHAQLRSVLGRWIVEDLGSRNGTRINGVPVQSTALADGDLIEAGRTFFLFRAAVALPAEAPADMETESDGEPGLSTLNPAHQRQLSELLRVAAARVEVVIEGESGTGKELIARAVHRASGRRGPFVAVNCGALPDSIAESELFGYRRGAFSDAKEDRPGLVRSADQGTLFLDEVGDLRPSVQGALLRVLQEHEVLPLGATQASPVDLRVCVASQRSLAGLVEAGRFRADLHARLAGFTIRLPPLRERREDLGLILGHLTRRLAAAPERVGFDRAAARALLLYPWPMNVREMEKCLAAAFALAGDGPVELAHLPEAVRAVEDSAVTPASAPAAPEPEPPSEAARREELTQLLAQHEGNISAVARALGKERVQIRRWLKRYRLDPDRFRRS